MTDKTSASLGIYVILLLSMTFFQSVALIHAAEEASISIGASGSIIRSHSTISASAGSGGIIDPMGDVSVINGGSQAFTVTPSAGYHILDVLVDGSSVGAVGSYEFTGVSTDHTIAASFMAETPATWTISTSAGMG